MKQITSLEYLELCRQETLPLLDVRAPVEFSKGHFPSSANLPILTDQERADVGTCYKQQGQAAAIVLGTKLTEPFKQTRVAGWKDFLAQQKTPILTCFRGGLRSRTAQAWLASEGFESIRLQGGYKALRGQLVSLFEMPYEGYVLAGLTGSGKTTFIQKFSSRGAIDIEGIARHRGSSFGKRIADPQPEQASFENHLALALWQADFPRKKILVENESRLVGRMVIPKTFYDRTRELPRVFLECPMEERISNIYREYVEEPLAKFSLRQVREHLVDAIGGVKNRLGGLLFQEIEERILRGLQTGNKETHREWIELLLTRYYDPQYNHAIEKYTKEVAFAGNASACAEWLKDHL